MLILAYTLKWSVLFPVMLINIITVTIFSIVIIIVDLASNQSCEFEDLFPKVAKAVRYIVSRRTSHFSVAESPGCKDQNSFSKVWANCSVRSGWDILLTSIRGIPFVFVWWTFFGCILILQHTKEWSVSCHSPHCSKRVCGERSW